MCPDMQIIKVERSPGKYAKQELVLILGVTTFEYRTEPFYGVKVVVSYFVPKSGKIHKEVEEIRYAGANGLVIVDVFVWQACARDITIRFYEIPPGSAEAYQLQPWIQYQGVLVD